MYKFSNSFFLLQNHEKNFKIIGKNNDLAPLYTCVIIKTYIKICLRRYSSVKLLKMHVIVNSCQKTIQDIDYKFCTHLHSA